jgi:transcriptional regulator GlxA family with amidase domain
MGLFSFKTKPAGALGRLEELSQWVAAVQAAWDGRRREEALTFAARHDWSERFATLIGAPPMQYLTRWRTSLAASRLRESHVSILRVATDVGYESEAAFNRAFKRVTGVTPGRWRAGAGERPQ